MSRMLDLFAFSFCLLWGTFVTCLGQARYQRAPQACPLALLGLVGLAFPANGGAEPVPSAWRVQQHGKASVWFVAAQEDPPELRLSGELVMLLRVEGADPLEVEVDELKSSAEWRLRQRSLERTKDGDKGMSIWQQELVLTPLQPGDHALQLPALRYRAKGAAWETVTWKPITLRITTQVAKADPNAARDITNTEELPVVEKPSLMLWLGAALALAAVTAAIFLVRRRRLQPRPARPPAEVAILALDRLAQQPPTTADESERFHTQLSLIVRRYLAQRFGLPAQRQTSTEFLADLAREPLPPPQQELVRSVLTSCDLAKFAPLEIAARECTALLAHARSFIVQTTSPDRPVTESLSGKREGEAPAEPRTAKKPAEQEPRPPANRLSG